MAKETGKLRISLKPHPEPFNDGECLHYAWFHPQLEDMIGTEGYFYDFKVSNVGQVEIERLGSVNKNGYPVTVQGMKYAYFAAPIKPKKPETETTAQEAIDEFRNAILDVVEVLNEKLQEVADKFGVPVEQLRIKE